MDETNGAATATNQSSKSSLQRRQTSPLVVVPPPPAVVPAPSRPAAPSRQPIAESNTSRHNINSNEFADSPSFDGNDKDDPTAVNAQETAPAPSSKEDSKSKGEQSLVDHADTTDETNSAGTATNQSSKSSLQQRQTPPLVVVPPPPPAVVPAPSQPAAARQCIADSNTPRRNVHLNEFTGSPSFDGDDKDNPAAAKAQETAPAPSPNPDNKSKGEQVLVDHADSMCETNGAGTATNQSSKSSLQQRQTPPLVVVEDVTSSSDGDNAIPNTRVSSSSSSRNTKNNNKASPTLPNEPPPPTLQHSSSNSGPIPKFSSNSNSTSEKKMSTTEASQENDKKYGNSNITNEQQPPLPLRRSIGSSSTTGGDGKDDNSELRFGADYSLGSAQADQQLRSPLPDFGTSKPRIHGSSQQDEDNKLLANPYPLGRQAKFHYEQRSCGTSGGFDEDVSSAPQVRKYDHGDKNDDEPILPLLVPGKNAKKQQERMLPPVSSVSHSDNVVDDVSTLEMPPYDDVAHQLYRAEDDGIMGGGQKGNKAHTKLNKAKNKCHEQKGEYGLPVVGATAGVVAAASTPESDVSSSHISSLESDPFYPKQERYVKEGAFQRPKEHGGLDKEYSYRREPATLVNDIQDIEGLQDGEGSSSFHDGKHFYGRGVYSLSASLRQTSTEGGLMQEDEIDGEIFEDEADPEQARPKLVKQNDSFLLSMKKFRRDTSLCLCCLACGLVILGTMMGALMGVVIANRNYENSDKNDAVEGRGTATFPTTLPSTSKPTEADIFLGGGGGGRSPISSPAPVTTSTAPVPEVPTTAPFSTYIPVANVPTTPVPTPPTADPLFALIARVSFDQGAAIRVSDTPQNRAFAWLQTQDALTNGEGGSRQSVRGRRQRRRTLALPEARIIQRYALACFYFGTNGDEDWVRKDGWLNGTLSECEWHVDDPNGFGCTGDTSQVTALKMVNNRITGNLVPEVAFLSGLRVLHIDNVVTNEYFMTGGIPPEFRWLKKLEFVNIVGNRFTYGLAEDLFQDWTSATLVNLARNDMPGSIPNFPSSAAFLTALVLNDNRLTGSIPVDLPTSLQLLVLNNNQLQFEIPLELSKLVLLKGLFLNHNNLTGDFPNIFSGMTGLRTGLDLSDNQLQGVIPANAFSNLRQLRFLDLSGNNFEGPLPDLTSLNASLRTLVLSPGNLNLTGVVPASVCAVIESNQGTGIVDCNKIACTCCCT